MADIQTIGFKIDLGTTNVESLESAISVLRKLKTVASDFSNVDLSNFEKFATNLEKVAAASKKLDSVKLDRFESRLRKLGYKVDDIRYKLEQTKSALDGTEEASPKTPTSDPTVNIPKPEEVDKSTKSVTGLVGALAAFGRSDVAAALRVIRLVSSLLSRLGKLVSKAFHAIVDKPVAIMKSLAGLMTKSLLFPFTSIGKGISAISKEISGFVGKVGRLTVLKLIRGALSEISDGLKVGTENLYYYSKAVGTEFAPSMDKASTSMLYFKNSIGAMVAPLVNALVPVLDVVIDKIVDVVNTINMMLARLTGASTWTKALKYPTEYKEALQKGTKAAKDFTASFDELNVLNDKTSSASAVSLDYEKMFEEVDVENVFGDWVDNLKTAIKNGDWSGVGTTLGETLNGAILGMDFSGAGSSVAEKINALFTVAFAFLNTVDTEGMGVGVATFLNHLIDGTDTHLIGSTLASVFNRATDFVFGTSSTFDWETAGRKTSDYVVGWFETLDSEKIGKTINSVINGAITFVESFISSNEIVGKIASSIGNLIKGLDVGELLTNALYLGKHIFDILNSKATIDLIRKGFVSLIGTLGKDSVRNAFKSFLLGLFEFAINMMKMSGELLPLFSSLFTDTIETASEAVLESTGMSHSASSVGGRIFTSMFAGINLPRIAEYGRNVGSSFIDGAKDIIGIKSAQLTLDMSGIKRSVTDGMSGVKDTFENGIKGINFDSIGTKFQNAVNDLPTKMSNSLGSVKTSIDSKVSEFGTSFSVLPDKFKPAFNNAIGLAQGFLDGITDAFNGVLGNIDNLGNVTINGEKPGNVHTVKLEKVKIPKLAGGGLLNAGSLFVAGESGAEAVGQFGNRTGVMNTQQMADAVSMGVYDAVTSAMSGNNSNGQVITINLDGRTIWSNQNEITRNRGYDLGLGGFTS